MVGLKEGKIYTDLYCKPIDRHQYLHYTSSHPGHVKKSIVYSQTLRLKGICSKRVDFQKHFKDMENWFGKRGYPEEVVKSQMERVKFRVSDTPTNSKQALGVPFVVTYHPKLNCISSIIRRLLSILYVDKDVKTLFSPMPMVSFRGARKFNSYLVRAKLYPLEKLVGSTKCDKSRCQVCNNINETATFERSSNGTKYHVNHKLNCDDKCLIYLITCKVCKIQYVGQTTEKFRLRWNNYRNCFRKTQREEVVPQQSFHNHFLREDHNGLLADAEITLIDKTDGADPTRRERYWIHKLMTRHPNGLNVDESYF